MGPQALTLLAAGLLLTASDSKGDAAREEMAKLQGTWQFVRWEAQGVAKPAEEVKQYTTVLKGDQWTVSKGDKIAAQIIFRVDPTKTPKTLDFIDINRARNMRGIYALEGDMLKFCDRDVEKGSRPTEFATKPDSGLVLVVLHRIKPGGPLEDVAEAERAKFQGNWRFVSIENQGERTPDTAFKKQSVVFKGDQWTVSEDHRIAAQTFFRVDPTKTPKTIDIVDIDKGRITRGIYALKGDTLTICDRGAGRGGRPTEFSTKPGSGFVLIVLNRVKP